MDRIDSLPKEIRELIHEYGYTVVDAFLNQKVTKASAIRHLIQAVMRGSLDASYGGARNGQGRDLVVVPEHPTIAMVEASMATVANHDMEVDKFTKHRLRIDAALKAGTVRRA
jgi:hypothetical protein